MLSVKKKFQYPSVLCAEENSVRIDMECKDCDRNHNCEYMIDATANGEHHFIKGRQRYSREDNKGNI